MSQNNQIENICAGGIKTGEMLVFAAKVSNKTKLTLEKKKFEIFMAKFQNKDFSGQRLGQAFYDYFKLHKLSDQMQLNNLYAKDGQHAINLINVIFDFN